MYHRYSPTANGQFHREAVAERKPSPPPPRPPDTPPPCAPSFPPPKKPPNAPPVQMPLTGFLPFLQGADSGDLLLLMILLLLMADGNEDSSTVALTLAIFLFLQ